MPTKSQGPTLFKCRPREHADMAKNLARRPLRLKENAAGSSTEAPGRLRQRLAFGETGTSKIVQVLPKSQ